MLTPEHLNRLPRLRLSQFPQMADFAGMVERSIRLRAHASVRSLCTWIRRRLKKLHTKVHGPLKHDIPEAPQEVMHK